MRTTLRTLDLFHGAGGSSAGAKKAGATIVAGIDFWKPASDTFHKNFPKANLICDDIRAVSIENFHKEIGDIDLIIASPECTNHSCAKGAKIRCEESKKTAFQVTRFAREFRPKWMVIENVVQMQSWSGHAELLKDLWQLGYYVKEEKINAQDFGVPQSRRRLYLLCSLSGEAKSVIPSRRTPKPASSIIDFEGEYTFTPLRTKKRAQPTIERAERAIAALGSNVQFLIVYYGTDASGGWQSLDRPLRTITTLDRFAYVQPSSQGHVMRMLQPEELKLAMGFDKRYKLLEYTTRRNKIKLMGNAVCPPVMKHLVKLLSSQ